MKASSQQCAASDAAGPRVLGRGNRMAFTVKIKHQTAGKRRPITTSVAYNNLGGFRLPTPIEFWNNVLRTDETSINVHQDGFRELVMMQSSKVNSDIFRAVFSAQIQPNA